MKISENKNICFFLIPQGSLNTKIRFLGQKMCSVTRVQTDGHTHIHTDTQTDTQVNTQDTLFRVSGIFPTTYHQGSVQKTSLYSCKHACISQRRSLWNARLLKSVCTHFLSEWNITSKRYLSEVRNLLHLGYVTHFRQPFFVRYAGWIASLRLIAMILNLDV